MPLRKIVSVFKAAATDSEADGVFFNNLSDNSYDSADEFDVTQEDLISVRALGPMRKKMLLLSEFVNLKVSICADVEWVLSENKYLIIEAPDSFLKYLTIDVSDGCLSIGSRANLSGIRPKIKIFASILSEVHVSNRAQIKLEDMDCQRLIASASDSSVIELSGIVSEAHFEVTGFSHIDALSLTADIVVVEIHTDSLVLCKSSEALQAVIYRNGILVNIGNPKIVDIEHLNSNEM